MHDDPNPLEYRAIRDDRADVRNENARGAWNALFLLITLAGVSIGAVAGLVSLCAVVIGSSQDGVPTNWAGVAAGACIALVFLWVAYWGSGQIDSD